RPGGGALLFLKGFPAVLLGLVAWFLLADKPADVAWLDAAEKKALADALSVDAPRASAHGHLGEILRDPRVYVAGLVYFCIYSSTNTMGYWMPTLIRGPGGGDLKTMAPSAG